MYCVLFEPIFPACGGHTTKLVSKEFLRAQERASTIRKTIYSSSRAGAVPGVFTSVGTRFCYSQNDLDSGSRADAGLGVFTSVGTHFYYSQN